jgi:hypothetical protein
VSAPGLRENMSTEQLVRYRGRTVAGATSQAVFVTPDLAARPTGDPEVRFILYMAAYAREILAGELPGPYTDDKAKRFARAALIPEELYERPIDDIPAMAAYLGMPADELEAAVGEAAAISRHEGPAP